MYEEPYKWVEAIGNRRQYLDEQFKQGSPVVALAYDAGILLVSVSQGTPKLYEIYDRLALGGMGHPADLKKLRFSLLEMAHVEGFNRSPSGVTGSRMVKYGIAPVIKQAFEEVFKAPFIVKFLLAELGHKAGKESFLVINYDGTFEEGSTCAVLAASKLVEHEMVAYIRREVSGVPSLEQAFGLAASANLQALTATRSRSQPAPRLRHHRSFGRDLVRDDESQARTSVEPGMFTSDLRQWVNAGIGPSRHCHGRMRGTTFLRAHACAKLKRARRG